jgi:hypothetical protein
MRKDEPQHAARYAAPRRTARDRLFCFAVPCSLFTATTSARSKSRSRSAWTRRNAMHTRGQCDGWRAMHGRHLCVSWGCVQHPADFVQEVLQLRLARPPRQGLPASAWLRGTNEVLTLRRGWRVTTLRGTVQYSLWRVQPRDDRAIALRRKEMDNGKPQGPRLASRGR